ncbi:MAG: MotA/TolQ/ExbB proton channel family protein [Paludibacteraceae bacterium]|nr:MotA/TolQ/ExbB proton channel family protein [Paludibacteraceae bacterium]MBR4712619.1 MotA/TolQ/ExbB proton channel family protein [Paludibacteraceae bacterium]MBR5375435.1 MotA/TolQ/ExbB proton channel family protein [Paludibacteraceae bacterium]
MKKIFASLAIVGALTFGFATASFAQEFEEEQTEQTVNTDEAVAEPQTAAATPAAEPAKTEAKAEDKAAAPQETGLFNALKIKFIEGGAGFMAIVALCLILGLALCIERIITLSLSSINTKKFLEKIEEFLANKNVEGALEYTKNTRGPIASIFNQGLSRISEGPDVVEKTVVSYGSVQMGALEKNITWISLCIALAPMLGFMGTVIGMIEAFDKIQAAGDISATVVAGGIKVALLTTVFGLIVAMILQLFMNFILTRIEALTTEMEDSSIKLLDMVVEYFPASANVSGASNQGYTQTSSDSSEVSVVE